MFNRLVHVSFEIFRSQLSLSPCFLSNREASIQERVTLDVFLQKVTNFLVEIFCQTLYGPEFPPLQGKNRCIHSFTLLKIKKLGLIMNFSFFAAKVPFPLTLRFKPMLQQGIELLTLDASW